MHSIEPVIYEEGFAKRTAGNVVPWLGVSDYVVIVDYNDRGVDQKEPDFPMPYLS